LVDMGCGIGLPRLSEQRVALGSGRQVGRLRAIAICLLLQPVAR
jgi:hypothetical protein